MFDTLASLLTLLTLLTASYALGRPLVRGLRLDEENVLWHVTWSLSLGMLAAGLLLTGLGMVGCLHREVIGVLTLASALGGVGQVVQERRRRDVLKASVVACNSLAGRMPQWLQTSLTLACALVALGSLAGSLAPATDGDALSYHLELPKLFLADRAIEYHEFNDNSTYPLLTEMWYLWALSFDTAVAAQLVHWTIGLLLAAAAVLLADDVMGRPWSWLAGAIVLLVPGVANQMTAPLNDAALALCTTLALIALRRATTDDDILRWHVAAGLMLGAAWSVKYSALAFTAAVGAIWLWGLLRSRRPRAPQLAGAAAMLLIAASVSGIWYVRAAWHRGNPVYPFFAEHMGQAGPDALPDKKTPLPATPSSIALAPWLVTMHPERFGGRGHQLGAAFLMLLPALLLCRRLHGLGSLLAAALAYACLWFFLRQNVRFLYPIVPLLAAGVAWAAMELRRAQALPKYIVMCSLAAVLGFQCLLPMFRARDQLAAAVGWESRDSYLLRREPSYQAALVARAALSPKDRILSQDYRTFYFPQSVTREAVFHRVTHYDDRVQQPGDLSRVLLDAGFTHVLLAEAAGSGIRYKRRLSNLVQAEEQKAPPGTGPFTLASYEFDDLDGARRKYRLVKLR